MSEGIHVFSSDDAMGSSHRSHIKGVGHQGFRDDAMDLLVKEMQAQSPSIYDSVKNLIAYLIGM